MASDKGIIIVCAASSLFYGLLEKEDCGVYEELKVW